MVNFQYTVRDPLGIHARPAGLIAKKVKELGCEVQISCRGKGASGAKLLSLMGLGVKGGDVIEISVSGEDEEAAGEELKSFLASIL